MLGACGGDGRDWSSDSRTRRNEVHITIHQGAGYNDPVIGWAVENGTPSKNDFHTDARFLELTALGNADNPTECAVVIERTVSTQPDEDPSTDDPVLLGGEDPTTEHSYTIPCSQSVNSTRIVWPDGSIVMTGHIEDAAATVDSEDSSPSENAWSFKIDSITHAPRITKFDPVGSFKSSRTGPNTAPN
jgi:hypothetical protein